MQLKKKKSLSVAVAAATTTLMNAAIAAGTDDVGWEIDTSVLYYGEQDDRVQDTSIATRVSRLFEDGRQVVFGVTVDSLTGATPMGAVPVDQPQTFTRPSGNTQYVTDAGVTPLDDGFRDTRTAGYVNWTQPISENWFADVGLSFSTEFDYLHLGVNGSLSREFNGGNTTLSGGFAYAADEWDIPGGIPIPLTEMQGIGNFTNKEAGTRDRTVTDVLFGINQVINERMIAQLNYSFSQSDDYLNDPYKFVSVLDAQGDPVAGPAGLNSYRFESRPDTRTQHSVFAKLKTYIGGGTLDTSYRFLTDDWGIDSHTFDVRYRFNLSDRNYLEPHVRFYIQSQADFYQANLAAADPLPRLVSADYRLAKITGTTVGIKYGHRFTNGNEASARLEWYNQSGDGKLVGVTGGVDVFPELNALIFQMSYRFHL